MKATAERTIKSILDWLTRWFPYVFAGLGLACVVLAVTNVALVLSNSNLRGDVQKAKVAQAADHATIVARAAEEKRQAKLAQIIQCRNAIPALARANLLIDTFRANLREQAETSRQKAPLEATAAAKAFDLATARKRDRAAGRLEDFPPVTAETCNALAVKLLGKKGAKPFLLPTRKQR